MGIEVRSHIGPEKPEKDLELVLLDLDSLVPHEMTIDHELDWFTSAVQESGVVYWGILVAKDSNLILDGHHRTAGLKKLGYSKGPAHVINYLDDSLVTLGTWYPRVNATPDKVAAILTDIGLEVSKIESYDLETIINREITAYVGNIYDLYQVNGEREAIFKQVRDLWIDDAIYFDDPDMCIVQSGKDQSAIVSWAYTKKEILQHVKDGIVHLPKTTRHELSFNIRKTNYPLSKL